jgi:hypothetical protein
MSSFSAPPISSMRRSSARVSGANPNFYSNKSAFDLDKETGRMLLRKGDQITDDHYQMLVTLSMSGDFFRWLIAQFDAHVAQYFLGAPPAAA